MGVARVTDAQAKKQKTKKKQNICAALQQRNVSTLLYRFFAILTSPLPDCHRIFSFGLKVISNHFVLFIIFYYIF